jgi:hypothetical protein
MTCAHYNAFAILYKYYTYNLESNLRDLACGKPGMRKSGLFSTNGSIFVRRSEVTNFYGSRMETIQLNCVDRNVMYINSLYMYILGVCTIYMVKFN